MKTVRAKVHVFPDDTTGEVYDQSQYRDDIEMGDVLVVNQEKVVGFLLSAWPVAVTKAHGALHCRERTGFWSNVIRDDERDYTPSLEAAVEEARRRGWPLDNDGANFFFKE